VDAVGGVYLGAGGATAPDVHFYRSAANMLEFDSGDGLTMADGPIVINRTPGLGVFSFVQKQPSDTYLRFGIDGAGGVYWGDGTGILGDAWITRTAANELTLGSGDHLKTDDPTADQHVATKVYTDKATTKYETLHKSVGFATGYGLFVNATKQLFSLTNGASTAIQMLASAANVAGQVDWFYFDDANYLITGRTLKMVLKSSLATNNTRPFSSGKTLKVGLYPVTMGTGANGVLNFVAGTVVTGSEVTFTFPAASAVEQAQTAEFSVPADGWYCMGAISDESQIANSAVGLTAQLLIRNT
jgi:hypothetical protein